MTFWKRRGYSGGKDASDVPPPTRIPSGSIGQRVVSTAMIPPNATEPPPPPPPYEPRTLAEPPPNVARRRAGLGPVVIPRHFASLHEPGVTHEHHCLASIDHSATDHTCRCGKTWPDPLRERKAAPTETDPDIWVTTTSIRETT